jgi:hypothetical protein
MVQDRDPSADDAGSIFVVDVIANVWFGRGPDSHRHDGGCMDASARMDQRAAAIT